MCLPHIFSSECFILLKLFFNALVVPFFFIWTEKIIWIKRSFAFRKQFFVKIYLSELQLRCYYEKAERAKKVPFLYCYVHQLGYAFPTSIVCLIGKLIFVAKLMTRFAMFCPKTWLYKSRMHHPNIFFFGRLMLLSWLF